MKITATMIAQQQADNRKRFAMDRLLHELRRFMRAYPMQMNDEMPEHDLVWVDDIMHGGPGKAIVDAIKANPVLWTEALPPEVCIVPRKTLASLGLSQDAVDYYAGIGMLMVEDAAAHFTRTSSENDDGRW